MTFDGYSLDPATGFLVHFIVLSVYDDLCICAFLLACVFSAAYLSFHCLSVFLLFLVASSVGFCSLGLRVLVL